MKTTLVLGAILAATASAAPLIEYGNSPSFAQDASPVGKQVLGGLSTPAAFSSTLKTAGSPTNYGNINLGTGMMPTQVVHYGTEDHPDHGYISPVLASTTAKEVDFQLAKAEKAGHLINADVDIGKLNLARGEAFPPSKYADEESEEQDPVKWGGGYDGYYYHPWGYRGWGY